MDHDSKRQKLDLDSDSDQEEWEEIVMDTPDPTLEATSIPNDTLIEIELQVQKKTGYNKEKRLARQYLHQAHVLCLLGSCLYNLSQVRSPLFISSIQLPVKTNFKDALSTFHSHFKVNGEILDINLSAGNELSPISFVLVFYAYTIKCGIECRLTAGLSPIPRTFTKIPITSIDLWIELYQNEEYIGYDVHQQKLKKSECPYIISFGEFGFRDVTVRYVSFYSLTLRKRTNQWWDIVCWLYSKSTRTISDELEDHQLEQKSTSDRMPSNLNGFINHPLFVLEKQLHKDQVLYPFDESLSIGIFKKCKVYPRELVKTVYSRQQWKTKGRWISNDTRPVKVIKRNQKDIELFGEWQTKDWPVEIIKNGIIPKNEYGCFEVLHPCMVPVGAVHLLDSSISQTAKFMGIDYAQAMTGFDFKKNQVIPRYQGILVAKEVEVVLVDVHVEIQRQKAEKLKRLNESKVLGRWRKLVIGMQLKKRLEKDYL